YNVGSGVASGTSVNANLATLPSVNAADVVVQADINAAVGQHAGLVARHGALGDSSMYLGIINNIGGTPIAQIFRSTGGGFTLLAQANATGNSGTLRFEVVGTSLRLFLGNTLQVFASDSVLKSGSVG